ncbi:carbohydrate binding domain-containing protein [Ruminococcus sp. XPD3002]|uniref:carbohydrate binding domain-containing protein n=1 Tax=Ruminococcus sp. XPD3002 TaxID=1452269 RepID=UPI0009163B14|nr:fibro-slime domain-containing protein [Ruminococcus flavefaciens]
MKNNFYEGVSKKRSRRRRFTSLVLVLSLFVTSGVSWSLHGVGITMANESECGQEEHKHTDECYEKQLVCGLEEDENHIHSDECYETKLVCGKTEHVHDEECYIDSEGRELLSNDDLDEVVIEGAVINPNGDIVIGDNKDEENSQAEEAAVEAATEFAESSPENEITATDIAAENIQPMLLSDSVDIPSMFAEGDSTSLPPTINTVDNIAEGIKFTLFDYGDSNLEAKTNSYEWQWVEPVKNDAGEVIEPGYWTHPKWSSDNVDRNGWKDYGINSGRNPADDILFFAYGTPVSRYCGDPDVHNINVPVYDDDGNKIGYRVTDYLPDKNSYAGDYNANPQYSGNRAVQGIVQSDLGADGYPHIVGSDNSLKYLFSPDTTVDGVNMSEYKKVYNGVKDQGVNHLLRKETSVNGVDHLIFNSNENYAYFNKDTNNFEVYNTTFDIVNDAHHKAGDVNNIKFDTNENPIKYDKDVNPGFKIGFFPFDEYDESRKDPNYDGNGYNHHFGMTMEASFVNNKFDRVNVKEPITFKYSGDDDMWVFVDGKLALDLGGIHEPAGGMIDFSNGLVWTQDNGAAGDGVPLNELRGRLTDSDPDADNSLYSYFLQHSPELIDGYIVYDEHGNKVGEKTAEDAWDELPKPISINTSQTSKDKWIVKPITDYIPKWYENANGEHDIKMFYLERGGCYSNLAMEMNLPTLKPLSVTKDVDYKQHLDKTYDNTYYWFQVYEWDKTNETWVIPQSEHPDSPFYLKDNRFKIKAGERKKFDDLGQDRKFKVVEIGYGNNPQNNGPEVEMSSEVFEKVTVTDQNNEETTLSIIDGAAETEGAALKDMNSYNFKNTIQEDFTNINVKKKWSPNLKPESSLNDFVVKFKIMRTDSVTGETKQVALKKDGVKKRTFTISSQEWDEGVTITNLLSRYGDHIYTYTVEELNVPKGYKASYSESTEIVDGKEVKVLQVTNTDTTKTDIYVKKEWENTSSNDKKVKLRLTRQRVGYKDSTPTWVKVNIVDEAGNLIQSYSTEQYDGVDIKKYKGVYAGGAAEIRCKLPEGVEVIDPDNPVKSPSTLSAKYDDGFVVLDNLALENTEDPASTAPNEVTIKVTSNTAKDVKMILHHSFTRGENGWLPNGSTLSYTSDAGAYAKQDCLEVTDRYKAWSGARLNLDPALFKVNKTYTFSVYVKSPAATRFKMTFNNGLGHFEPITDPFVDAPRNGWVQLTGTIKLPAEIDPYGMYLLVETVPVGDDYDNYPCEADTFYMDEFIAIEGRDGIRVNSPDKTDEPDGTVEIIPDRTVYSIAFNDTIGDWEPRAGSEKLTNDHNSGFDYMVVDNRTAGWHGAKLNVPFLQKGHTYLVEATVQGNGSSNMRNVDLKLDTVDHPNGNEQYILIGSAAVTDSSAQYPNYVVNHISGSLLVPYYAKPNEMNIFFEANPANNQIDTFGSFRVHNITITDVTEPFIPPAMDGYHVANGRYYSDNSLYELELEKASVTNPMHLLSDYTPDRINNDDPTSPLWERVVTLDNTTGWKYYWNNTTDDRNHRIDEDAQNYLYKYYIEEVSIYDEAKGQWINVTNDAKLLTGESNDTDKSYLVSYTGNGVATNDAANPILIKNKYIWYKLPATGGIGVDFIYAIGLFLMITGLIGGTALIRRERRSD